MQADLTVEPDAYDNLGMKTMPVRAARRRACPDTMRLRARRR